MIHSFLLIGQSNMAGRGNIEDVDIICDSRIKVLKNGLWLPMTEPIHTDYPHAGVGPAATFATAWLDKHPDEEIGLIPCAMGGTSLSQWKVGDVLFDNAINMASLAMRTSLFSGFLWHQGESDCTNEFVKSYYDKLEAIVQGFRKSLNAEDLPFLIGGLGSFLKDCDYLETRKYGIKINELLQKFCLKEKQCFYVTADGLQSKEDRLHINAQSQRVFGLRFFAAYDQRDHIWNQLENEPDFIPTAPPLQGKERIEYIGKRLFGTIL